MYKREQPLEKVVIKPRRQKKLKKAIDLIKREKAEAWHKHRADLRERKRAEMEAEKLAELESRKFKANRPVVDQIWDWLRIK